jgi:hypothetical protein
MTFPIAAARDIRPASVPADLEDTSSVEHCARAETRSTRAEADAAIAHRVAAKLDVFIADMFSLIEAFQTRTRDVQSATQERDVATRTLSASQAHTQRTAELETAIVDRARAAESAIVSDVCRIIGSIVSIAVGALGAIFTGGASLVAAIAIVVAIVGPLVMNELGRAGVVDADVAAGVGIGIAAVCTAVSLGCSVASLAGAASTAALVVVDAATKAATEVVSNIGSILGGLVDVTAGSAEVGTAVLDHDAAEHETNATEHGQRRDAERELQERAMETLTALFHSFARVSESLAACREEASRARAIALRPA